MFKRFTAIALGAIVLCASSNAEARYPYGYGYHYYGPHYGCGPACATALGIGGLGLGIALGTIFSQPRVEYYPQPIYVPQPAPAPIVIERDCYYSPTYDQYGRYMGNHRYCR